ncbi:hypothetical protein PanWU01x14_308580 [Parasponia andersonii]|uniref:Uncharacterized protein n=1 Tax=Parasponia andersonii TaxID=3476 RepID=A0A2P5AQX5_PARAD|nr:hypothetical protein PanWU01x14_308580 [Parasponia andersonii]
MKGSLLRRLSLYAHSNSSLVPLAASTQSRLSFYYSSQTSDSSPNPKKDVLDDVSSQELKKRIEKYLEEGDEEAIPSIFEAILERKLAGMVGKHNEKDDDESVEQVCGKRTLRQEPESDVEDKEF